MNGDLVALILYVLWLPLAVWYFSCELYFNICQKRKIPNYVKGKLNHNIYKLFVLA